MHPRNRSQALGPPAHGTPSLLDRSHLTFAEVRSQGRSPVFRGVICGDPATLAGQLRKQEEGVTADPVGSAVKEKVAARVGAACRGSSPAWDCGSRWQIRDT